MTGSSPPASSPAWALGRAVVAALLLLAASRQVAAPDVSPTTTPDRRHVGTDTLELDFSPSLAAPVLWRACHPTCAAADASSGTSIRFAVAVRAGAPDAGLSRAAATADVVDTPGGRTVTFTSAPVDGVRLVTAFGIPRRGYEVTIAMRLVGPNADAVMTGRRLTLDLEATPIWSPPKTRGWVAIGDDVRRVMLDGKDVRALGDAAPGLVPLRPGQWIGFRDRFWALLSRVEDGARADLRRGPLTVVLESAPGAPSARYTVYSGPLDYGALGRADPGLRHLLFSGLWSWLRALSVGALRLLDGLMALVGRPGPAIILLAVAVKLLLLPVTTIAHHLQAQVDATRGRLQPEIDAIKARYRGEEQARRLLELYRGQRVHPLYTLKSLVGVLIQLPVFIAVFDMLAENFALHDASFLGIRDLAQPDGLIPLPLDVPGLGGRLNLLPFLMSGVSLAASARYDASALPPALARRQRRNLAAMAGLFFVLFYAFPAGMVLYWTSTNALQLAGREIARWRRRQGGE